MKIAARFKRVKEFMENYSMLLLSIEKRTKQYGKHLESPESIDEIVKQIQILEQKEVTASLKDKQNLANQLGISEFNRNKTQQDVIEVADTVARIKVSALTTPNSAFDEGVYWLKTPFKQVRVEAYANGNLMIYPKSKRVAPTYDVISLKLDGALDGKNKNDFIRRVVNPMINYLKQTVPIPTEDLKNQDLLDEIKPIKADKVDRKFLTDNQKEAAATLCGILMLSESHQFRNPTLGKFERSSVKRVKQLIQKGITNPFSVVYANKSGEYINAHDKTSDSAKDMSDGGHKQTHQLLRHKVIGGDMAINVQDLPSWINDEIDRDDDYVKIKDLDNNKKYKFFKEDKEQTIKEFVEKQLSRNMKDQYKKLNRTFKK